MPRALPEPREHRGCPDLPLRGFPPRSADTAGDAIQRPRRLHGARSGQTRRQPPDPPAIHPRRRRDVRDPWPGTDAALQRPPRVRVVRARRHARAQPNPVRRRLGRRRRQAEVPRQLGQAGARAPRATSEAGCRKSRCPGTERARRPPSRRRDADGNAAVRVRSLLHGLQVRSRELLPCWTRAARRPQRASDRVLPDSHVQRRAGPRQGRQRRQAGQEGRREEEGAEGAERARAQAGRRHQPENEQDGAGDAMGRSRRIPDRQVHLRQRLDGLPARRVARARRRYSRVDDDGPAVSGSVASTRDERARGRLACDGSVRSGLRAQVHELQAGGGEIHHSRTQGGA